MSARACFLVVAGLISSTAAAQQPPTQPNPDVRRPLRQRLHQPGGPGEWGGPGIGYMMYAPERLVNRREALTLTPDQVARLETLAQETRAAREGADTVARDHREQLRTLWDAAEPDVRAIETHLRAVNAAHQTAQVAAVTAAARAKAVLTAEQRGRVAGWGDGVRMAARRGMAPRMDRPGFRGFRPGPGPRVRPQGPRRGQL